jgi:hypothetical protein
MNLTQSPRFVLRPPAVALIVAGLALIALAFVYFVTPAHQLPSLLPGHDATNRHHIKHGLAMLTLAGGAWVGAWFSSAPASPDRQVAARPVDEGADAGPSSVSAPPL